MYEHRVLDVLFLFYLMYLVLKNLKNLKIGFLDCLYNIDCRIRV